jgi:hypothetical protein
LSERRRYWEQRLASPDLRAAWYEDLEKLGLWSSTHAYDGAGKVDTHQAAYLMGRRDVAVEQLAEATRVAQSLVAQTLNENLAPRREEKEEEKKDG